MLVQQMSNWVGQRDSGLSRQTNDRQTNDTRSEIKLLQTSLYASWGTASYKKVVMRLVTNLLELVNLVQKLNYVVDPLVLTYSTLVHC